MKYLLALFSLCCFSYPIVHNMTKDKIETETITVYTTEDIYYLEGNSISTESKDKYVFGTREKAIAALEEFTARDANTLISVGILTDSYYCECGRACNEDRLVDFIVSRKDLDKIDINPIPLDGKSPLDILEDYSRKNMDFVSVLYDY